MQDLRRQSVGYYSPALDRSTEPSKNAPNASNSTKSTTNVTTSSNNNNNNNVVENKHSSTSSSSKSAFTATKGRSSMEIAEQSKQNQLKSSSMEISNGGDDSNSLTISYDNISSTPNLNSNNNNNNNNLNGDVTRTKSSSNLTKSTAELNKSNNEISILDLDQPLQAQSEEDRIETESLNVEERWVLTNELPLVCSELKDKLQRFVEIVRRKKFPKDEQQHQIDKSELPPDSQLLDFNSPENTLSGHVRLEGSNISEAEIKIFSPKWSKDAKKFNITIHSQFKLLQLTNAYNYVKRCLDVVQLLLPRNPLKSIDSNYAKRCFSKITENLRQAMNEFVIANKSAIPINSPALLKALKPDVSQELVVEIFLQNVRLEMAVYCLQIHQPPNAQINSQLPTQSPMKINTPVLPPKVVPSHPHPHPSTSLVGQMFQHKHNGTKLTAEVVDFAQASCESVYLQKAYSLLSSAFELSLQLVDKLEVFGWRN